MEKSAAREIGPDAQIDASLMQSPVVFHSELKESPSTYFRARAPQMGDLGSAKTERVSSYSFALWWIWANVLYAVVFVVVWAAKLLQPNRDDIHASSNLSSSRDHKSIPDVIVVAATFLNSYPSFV